MSSQCHCHHHLPMPTGTPFTTPLMSSREASLEDDVEHVGPASAEGTQRSPSPVVQPRCGILRFGRVLLRSLKIVIFTPKLNVLLPLAPAAILVDIFWENQGLIFILSLLGLAPLAERLGYATEQLAFYTGETVGGLLNCTFGNAPELVVSIFAMRQGLLRIVQQSLLGSILSNMLLVLGSSFFGGGIASKKVQSFDKPTAVMNSGMLLMAVMGLLLPAALHYTRTESHSRKSELALSRFSSCVMLVAYACHLIFQFKSQKSHDDQMNEEAIDSEVYCVEEVAEISKWEAIIWLAIFCAWISITSDYLVGAIEGAADEWNVPIAFISVIMLPIVGNAPEHATAFMFAMKDKLDLTVGIAIGSSTQISMLGIPFAVLLGWMMGLPMDLNFQLFETAVLFITVLIVVILLQEGTTNYCKGMLLVLCYTIVAASFYVHVDATSAIN